MQEMGITEYSQLVDLALNKKKWRKVVEAKIMEEQLRVAREISDRRSGERKWGFGDHNRLMRRARSMAMLSLKPPIT